MSRSLSTILATLLLALAAAQPFTAHAAGAYLGSGDAGSTSGTSHSASVNIPSGTDLFVVVVSRWRTVAGSTVAPTSVTVNGVAAADTGGTPYGDQDIRWMKMYYYLSPPSGSQTVVASGGGVASDVTQYSWIAYSGFAQSGQPDNVSADATETNTGAYAKSVTVNTADAWVIAAYANQGNGTPTSYTNGTARVTNNGGGTGGWVADSNGSVGVGSYTITLNQNTQFTTAIAAAFKISKGSFAPWQFADF